MRNYNEIYIDDGLTIPPGYELSQLQADLLKDVLMQEYLHRKYYRNWKCFLPWHTLWNRRISHKYLINKLWKKYKEIEHA